MMKPVMEKNPVRMLSTIRIRNTHGDELGGITPSSRRPIGTVVHRMAQ